VRSRTHPNKRAALTAPQPAQLVLAWIVVGQVAAYVRCFPRCGEGIGWPL
jgi:hypothetical protein